MAKQTKLTNKASLLALLALAAFATLGAAVILGFAHKQVFQHKSASDAGETAVREHEPASLKGSPYETKTRIAWNRSSNIRRTSAGAWSTRRPASSLKPTIRTQASRGH